VDAYRPLAGQVLFEPAHVVSLSRRRTKHHEALVTRLGDGEIADQLAEFVEHRRQHDAPGLRHAVGHQPVEEIFRTRAGNLVFGEVGDLCDADALAHRAHFVADMFEIVRAVE